ncbi:hypothetical protein WJX72_006327 [[Myrmecia] bisecta]|uniref:MIF4G domain-containing protein n=1 Tax=[Myrmecia] bisecta TaxID=41462 RepID=A0AAW1QF93_9CHLO
MQVDGEQKRTSDQAAPGLENDLVMLSRNLRRDLAQRPEVVRRVILDCAVELSTKTPIYSTLVGLLNADENEFVAKLVADAHAEFLQALAAGERHKARMLLRFFASLVVSNVLHPSSVMATMQAVVDTAQEIAPAGDQSDSGRQWQPYSDHLVYMALMALPWGGSELADSAPSEMERLFTAVEGYMTLRPRAEQPALRPFYEAADDEDVPAQSDSGAASFLGQVWAAVQELKSGRSWVLASIPRLYYSFEAQLASAQPHELPQTQVPASPPGIPQDASAAEQAAAVALAYPPRGIIKLIGTQHTEGERAKMERLVAEEYILDTIHFFDGDRVECARRLAKALPLPWSYEHLLAEMLFSQLLLLPSPPLKPLGYSTIMVDLCKIMPTFPRSMSACVRNCFTRMNCLDPELRLRLADWLAYHLSNFQFVWPWDKWEAVLQAPPSDGQRRFVIATLSKLIRLSYWGRVHSVLPESFHTLMPPQPVVEALEAPAEPPAEANGEENGHSTEAATSAEAKRAAEMLQMVRRKVMTEGMLQWIDDQKLREELGGDVGLLRMVGRTLMVAGAKSFTHMITALERYYDLLTPLLVQTGLEGEVALIDVAAQVWRKAPQRAGMAIDRLMALRLVSGEGIVRWVFQSGGVLSVDDELLSGLVWEVLYNAVNKTLARTQDAKADVTEAQQAVAAASAQQAEAGQHLAEANAAVEQSAEDMSASSSLLEAVTQARERQEAAAAAVHAAEEQVIEKLRLLGEASAQEQHILAQAFKCFKEVLADALSKMDTEDKEATTRDTW